MSIIWQTKVMIKFIVMLVLLSNAVVPCVALSAEQQSKVFLPIIMYHSVHNKSSRYVLDIASFKNDLQFLQDNGYKTIVVDDLINFQSGKTASLPAKSIILSFDDGFYNNYLTVFPLLKERNMRAILSVTGEFLDKEQDLDYRNSYSSIVRYGELAQMSKSGVFEIGNHSYNYHHIRGGRKGIKIKPNESELDYIKLVKEDTMQMHCRIREKIGVEMSCYTYPYGTFCPLTNKVLFSLGYKATITCNEGVNYISTTSSLMNLKRLERSNQLSLAQILKKSIKGQK